MRPRICRKEQRSQVALSGLLFGSAPKYLRNKINPEGVTSCVAFIISSPRNHRREARRPVLLVAHRGKVTSGVNRRPGVPLSAMIDPSHLGRRSDNEHRDQALFLLK